jgi:hypothetical protein
MSGGEFASLEASTVIPAPLDAVYESVLDFEGRARDMPSFQAIEISDRSEDGFVAKMFEHYGGRDVVVTSRIRFERPSWVSYEHLESPYGENRGRFTLTATAGGTALHHVHETKLDISEGSTLRREWLALMDEQLSAIARGALRLAGSS